METGEGKQERDRSGGRWANRANTNGSSPRRAARP